MDLTRNIITMGLKLKPNTVYRTVWTVEGREVHNTLVTTPDGEDSMEFLRLWAETAQYMFDIPHVDIQVFEVADDTRNQSMQ